MHEASLASSLLEVVRETARAHRMSRVTGLVLRVGALRMVVPELLQTAFTMVSRDTVADGAALEIVPVPVVARCRTCGQSSEVADWVFLCPACGSTETELQSGQEMDLVELSGEQGEST